MTATKKVICKNCKAAFKKRVVDIKRTGSNFCSRKCHHDYKKANAWSTQCKECGKITTNKSFCSRSCAATYNNRGRKRTRVCIHCDRPSPPNGKYCEYHRWIGYSKYNDDFTLGDLVYSNDANRYNHIRSRARTIYKNIYRDRSCIICGYDKHIHVAHIRDIGTFPEHTPLKEVNSHQNLAGLCPNCHWEFDNGLISKRNITNAKKYLNPIGLPQK